MDPIKMFNHTSWMDIVTHNVRNLSVCNRCVIEVIGGFLCFKLLFKIFL